MPVTGHTVREDNLQVGGRRYVRYFFQFDTGEEIQRGPKLVPDGFDTAADAVSLIPTIEADMVDIEDTRLQLEFDDGLRTDFLTVEPVHPSTDTVADRRRRFHRKFVRWAYKHSDLKEVRRLLYALWYWLKFDSGYNNAEIRTYLNVTNTQLTAFDTRMQAIHDNLAFIDADAEEEWE
jgi:hypothetical protein